MPTFPHQVPAYLPPSSSEHFFPSRDQPELSPSNFHQTSVPRGMANFNGFEGFEGLQSDYDSASQSGGFPGSFTAETRPDNMYPINEVPGLHYQLGTPVELNPYWHQGTPTNEIQHHSQPLENSYISQQVNAPHYIVPAWPNSSPPVTNQTSTPRSNYAVTYYNPTSSSNTYAPYSTIQASRDDRRSTSSELMASSYPSSSQMSPPLGSVGLPYSFDPNIQAEDSAHLDGHREQLKLFREALSLPMSYLAGPFVPQKMYIPHTNSDRRRYVEEIELQHPVYFWMQDPDECGILLIDALHSRVRRLHHRDTPVFEGRGPSISVRIQWPGYRPWSRQIPTKDFRSPPQPITRAKLAKNIAKCVERFLASRISTSLEDDVEPHWKVGTRANEIKLEDLILVSMHHVSMGSWQPHLRLRRPFSDSRAAAHP